MDVTRYHSIWEINHSIVLSIFDYQYERFEWIHLMMLYTKEKRLLVLFEEMEERERFPTKYRFSV